MPCCLPSVPGMRFEAPCAQWFDKHLATVIPSRVGNKGSGAESFEQRHLNRRRADRNGESFQRRAHLPIIGDAIFQRNDRFCFFHFLFDNFIRTRASFAKFLHHLFLRASAQDGRSKTGLRQIVRPEYNAPPRYACTDWNNRGRNNRSSGHCAAMGTNSPLQIQKPARSPAAFRQPVIAR